MSSQMIKLQSVDGETFNVDLKTASVSHTFRHMIEDGVFNNYNGTPLRLPNIKTGSVLAKIIEYCVKHASNEKKNEIKAWDEEFVKKMDDDVPTLFTFINAADYLDIENLLDLLLDKVADLVKDLEVEDVRKLWKITDPGFEEGEEAALREEHAWAFVKD